MSTRLQETFFDALREITNNETSLSFLPSQKYSKGQQCKEATKQTRTMCVGTNEMEIYGKCLVVVVQT